MDLENLDVFKQILAAENIGLEDFKELNFTGTQTFILQENYGQRLAKKQLSLKEIHALIQLMVERFQKKFDENNPYVLLQTDTFKLIATQPPLSTYLTCRINLT